MPLLIAVIVITILYACGRRRHAEKALRASCYSAFDDIQRLSFLVDGRPYQVLYIVFEL